MGRNPDQEFLDWASTTNGGIITSFQIGYATPLPVIDMDIVFYEGTTNTEIGTEIVSLSLTGLPGSATGGAELFTMDVDMSGATFPLPPGPYVSRGSCEAAAER